MKKYLYSILILGGLLTASCDSESGTENGRGKVMVDFTPDMSFSTSRAIVESDYTDIRNYNVKLIKTATDQVLEEHLYADWALAYEVESGVQYTVEASYGTESPASFDNLLVKGSETFTVQPGTTKMVSFQCKPQAAKVSVIFSDDYSEYFSDCDVTVKTQYMPSAQTLNISTPSPLYIKAGQEEPLTLTFTVKDKEGQVLPEYNTTKVVNVNPQTWLKITVKPNITEIEGGKFGINVILDDSLTDKDVNIKLGNEIFK